MSGCYLVKKLILIFGTFAIVCVIISYFVGSEVSAKNNDSLEIETEAVTVCPAYTVKSENGRIVVYELDELFYKTMTHVNTLPIKDQETLLYGIPADSKEEVNKILEQYCS